MFYYKFISQLLDNSIISKCVLQLIRKSKRVMLCANELIIGVVTIATIARTFSVGRCAEKAERRRARRVSEIRSSVVGL